MYISTHPLPLPIAPVPERNGCKGSFQGCARDFRGNLSRGYFNPIPLFRFPHRFSCVKPSSHEQRPLVRITSFESSALFHAHPITIPSATFHELGPPDLCHVIKSTAHAGQCNVSAQTSSLFLFKNMKPS